MMVAIALDHVVRHIEMRGLRRGRAIALTIVAVTPFPYVRSRPRRSALEASRALSWRAAVGLSERGSTPGAPTTKETPCPGRDT